MGFQGFIGRIALLVLAVALSSCGGSGSSEAVTATPTFSEGTGTYVGTQTITITDTTSSATIYYTTDGTTPTTASTEYTAPIPVGATLILEAIAVSSGHKDSAVASATYEITPASIPTAGIWLGIDSVSGDNVIALINAAGDAIFVRSRDYTQFAGKLTVTIAAITAPMTGYANFPATFADNSITGTGTFTGTVNQETSIDGQLAFSSAGGTSYPGSYDLGYSPVSTVASSGTAVAGTYTDDSTTDPLAGGTVTITETSATAATIASAGATSGCILSGTISTADATTDIYEVAYSYSGCTGTFSLLNGLALSGLAALNTAVSPVQLLIAVNGPGGGATSYGLESSLSLQ
jgi:hypothetical protein